MITQSCRGDSHEIIVRSPINSIQDALMHCLLKLDDIGLIELNEAFASQVIAVINEANFDINKVNVNGGAIALGHPLGATGSVLMTKLLHDMERKNVRYGLVALCIGGGQGITTVIENLNI